MNKSRKTMTGKSSGLRIALRVGVVTALGLTMNGCTGTAPGASQSGSTPASIRVGIFVDDAFGDGDFLDQGGAAKGPLASELNATVHTYEGQMQAQNFEPLLQDAATANDIVFVLGYEAADAMIKTASANPDTTFVFVDGVIDDPNIVSAEFRTAEGCFMAGALASTVNLAAQKNVAGFIGGEDDPVVNNCEFGFEQGVTHVDPAGRVVSQFVGSFTDPSKGSEIATSLANQGAYSEFPYAGLSGAGAFDAAKSGLNIAPIGVVADKSGLAPGKVPGSLTMGVDKVILALTQADLDGQLTKGKTLSYGFSEGGWAMDYEDSVLTRSQIAALKSLQESISNGTLVVNAKS